MLALKLLPHLVCWSLMSLVLVRGCAERRTLALGASCAAFLAGMGAALVLLRGYPAELALGIVRAAVGVSFIVFIATAVAALYRSTDEPSAASRGERILGSVSGAGAIALVSGLLSGAICACRVATAEGGMTAYAVTAVAACVIALLAYLVERKLPGYFTASPAGTIAALVALLLFSSSSIIRLDLFAPLTMKVMKFTHDFVHQFFESMLIPDHVFIRPYLWGYIGLLFGKEIGFWGGLLIWFVPVVLVVLAVSLQRLPKVSHIRQGALRRKLVAAALKQRRLKLLLPVLAALILAGAAYRSRYPSVEYWDPKPVLVTANAAGVIVIPKKGEVELEDGKLHKYLYRQGGKQARFFVLMTPAGKYTVDLDACAICKPDGYGQAEGSVICYYCKTLIPLETMGMPGGCNPVPVAFTEKDDGVHVDGLTLINTWGETIQSTTGGKGEGK